LDVDRYAGTILIDMPKITPELKNHGHEEASLKREAFVFNLST
jgi:hypothetical protein